MKHIYRVLIITTAILVVGCSSVSHVEKMTLRCTCDHPYEGGCISFYSFDSGVLTPPFKSERVDLVYWFDNDDCFNGALIGHDDGPGYLFVDGKRSLDEVTAAGPPADNAESIEAIELTKDNEGLAFWVKTSDGRYIPAKITAIHPATYPTLTTGGTARLELEWLRSGIYEEQ